MTFKLSMIYAIQIKTLFLKALRLCFVFNFFLLLDRVLPIRLALMSSFISA